MRLAAPTPPPLLLLLLLAAPLGARAAGTALPETESTTDAELSTTESTTESATTESTTESTTTESTTTESTTSRSAGANGTTGTNDTAGANGTAGAPTLPPSRSPQPLTPSPPSGNGTANGTAKGSAVPVSVGTSLPRANGTSGHHAAAGSTTTASSSETAPAPARGGPAPTGKGSVSGGAKATTAVLAGGGGTAKPSKAAAPAPAVLHMLLRVPLAFRVLNRDFSARLLDTASPEYGELSRSVLAVLDSVFGCAGCASRGAYKGCSSLRFSQGSVLVHAELVFGHDGNAVSGASAEKWLRDSLDPSGFIMGLQLSDIQSTADGSGTEPAVPPWAIALLVLVSVLVLLIVLLFCLMTTCSCRRKSRGKLFSAKDSYEPAAEYPPYQSHGRYAAPASKHSPYSQVAGSAGAGTFTYTNPAAPEQP